MDELPDILRGLEQRIKEYKEKLAALEKKKEKIDQEITTTKKYLELAVTLYKVELDKVKTLTTEKVPSPPSSSSEATPSEATEVTDQSHEILLGTSKYAGMSIPQAASLLLKEVGRPMHAKEIHERLVGGGVRIRAKMPVTSVANCLSRDKRFRKVAPNTFEISEP